MARQAIEESATKNQQREFVQQQCARLQEELCHGKVRTWQSQSRTEEDSGGKGGGGGGRGGRGGLGGAGRVQATVEMGIYET